MVQSWAKVEYGKLFLNEPVVNEVLINVSVDTGPSGAGENGSEF